MTHSNVDAPTGGTIMGASRKPYRIAVTGGIASGKSLVGKYLTDNGVPVIDTDDLSHELVDSPNPAYQKILDRFGADLVEAPGGPINRAKLAQVVFADAKGRADLEAILHPAILDLCEQRISALGEKEVIVVLVPLLFECGLENKYDEVWCVLVDRDLQLTRLKNRNGLSDDQAKARINAQWPQEKKAARSHRVIDNSGTPEETFTQVATCLEKARTQFTSGQPAQPVVSPRNTEYRDILKRFAELATVEVLDRMGDVSTTRHKDAEAQLSMSVLANEDGAEAAEHQLKVRLQMCVKNKKGAAGPDSPCVECSCNCGDNCRKGCACAANCGCSCKAPCPPPTTPPTPPAPPAPHCHPHKGFGGLLAFFGLLAFLAFLAAGLVYFHPWKQAEPPTCKPGPTCEDPIKGRPILVLTDEQFDKLFCKSKCEPPKPPAPPCPGTTCPPFEPPAPPVVPPPPAPTSCTDFVSPSATPPAFILPYLHNQVRFRVTEWTVRCRQNEQGAVVAGRDNLGRLVVWMEFGPRCTFVQQWIVNYSSNRVGVDLFAAPNRFVGRTEYLYDNDGRLSLVRRLDEQQRPLTTGTFERNPDGTLCKVVVRRFDIYGRLGDVQVSWYYPNSTLMIAEFFQYELFGQFK